MSTLIIKLGATGDVVRTSPLLRRLEAPVTWITESKNRGLLDGLKTTLRCFSWEERAGALDSNYDLVINLEDSPETSEFAGQAKAQRQFGAYADAKGNIRYSDDSRGWFDLSLISIHGREKADQLKLVNRRTYQDLIFEGLGLGFRGEEYLLPPTAPSELKGDVAVAPVAGAVWPMKNWAYYDRLKTELEGRGLKVNVLPQRKSLLEHLADVRGHRLLVGGDSLPMHFALGSGIPCVTLFTCTSPWEIHDYGRQTKIISPLLERYFYQRGFDPAATTAITYEEVLASVLARLG